MRQQSSCAARLLGTRLAVHLQRPSEWPLESKGGEPAGGDRAPAEFVIVGVSHRVAPVAVREKLAAAGTGDALLTSARANLGLKGAFLLSTCNRVECWGVAPAAPAPGVGSRIAHDLSVGLPDLSVLGGADAYLHAIRVASGLDSAVWGEPQIAAQVKGAAGGSGAGAPLADVVQGVLEAARAVRRQAGLPRASRGAPEAAADCLARAGAGKVLVLGAGPVGRLVAERVAPFADVTLAARDAGRAQRVAERLGTRGLSLAEGLRRMGEFEAAVVALRTDEPLVRPEHLGGTAAARGNLRLVIDLSFPRAVSPEARSVPWVRAVDIDDLAEEDARTRQEGEAGGAEEEARRWSRALQAGARARGPDATIGQLRRRAEAVRRDEVDRARHRLTGDAAADAAVLEKLTERIVGRLLHDPTEELRASRGRDDAQAVDRLARRLFRLEGPP